MIVLAYVIFIFCSLNVKGKPNFTRFFHLLISLIFILRVVSRTNIINGFLKKISDKNASNIYSLNMIGMDPDSGISVEIFLFITTILYVISEFDSSSLFPPSFYYENFKKMLPDFPDAYCYGIMDQIEHNLGMNISESNTSTFEIMRNSMKRNSLLKFYHHSSIFIVDIISFVLLFFLFPKWENETQAKISGTYILILIVHLIFMILHYFFCLSGKIYIFYWIQILYYVFTLVTLFFSILNSWSNSLKLYVLIRIIMHLIAANCCFIGKVNVSYKIPQFKEEWRYILAANNFLKNFPFVFELHSLLAWAGKKSKVSLNDFTIIQSVALDIECLICNKLKKQVTNNTEKRRFWKGFIYIILFLICFIFPFIFVYENTSNHVPNRIISAKLEFGFSFFPTFFEWNLGSSEVTNEELNQIISNIPDILYRKSDSLVYLLSFSPFSLINFSFSENGKNIFKIRTSDSKNMDIKPYLKFTFSMEYPATVASSTQIIHLVNCSSLKENEKNNLYDTFFYQNASLSFDIEFPIYFHITESDELKYKTTSVKLNLMYDDDSWLLSFDNLFKYIQSEYTYSFVLLTDGFDKTQSKFQSTYIFLILYLITILFLGILIRHKIYLKAQRLWLKHIDYIKLYQKYIEINISKNTGDIEAELRLSNEFLSLISEKNN